MFEVGQKVIVVTKYATISAVEIKRGKPIYTVRFTDGTEEKRGALNVEALPEFLPPQTAAEFFADGEAIKLIRRSMRPGGSFV